LDVSKVLGGEHPLWDGLIILWVHVKSQGVANYCSLSKFITFCFGVRCVNRVKASEPSKPVTMCVCSESPFLRTSA